MIEPCLELTQIWKEATTKKETERSMAEENRVILHGTWASPYAKRVELALRVKGIPFDYIEEDLKNKSPLLLKHNPIHKKVPVLVHKGNPISESLIIIEYIDETWKNNGTSLLPKDPYKRAQIRFWVTFLHQKLFDAFLTAFKTSGEVQKRAVWEVSERLRQVEEGLKGLISEEGPFVNGEEMGVLDIVMCSFLGAYKLQQEVLGIAVIDSEKCPLMVRWLSAMAEHPVVKKATPPPEKIVDVLRFLRQNALQSPAA